MSFANYSTANLIRFDGKNGRVKSAQPKGVVRIEYREIQYVLYVYMMWSSGYYFIS